MGFEGFGFWGFGVQCSYLDDQRSFVAMFLWPSPYREAATLYGVQGMYRAFLHLTRLHDAERILVFTKIAKIANDDVRSRGQHACRFTIRVQIFRVTHDTRPPGVTMRIHPHDVFRLTCRWGSGRMTSAGECYSSGGGDVRSRRDTRLPFFTARTSTPFRISLTLLSVRDFWIPSDTELVVRFLHCFLVLH